MKEDNADELARRNLYLFFSAVFSNPVGERFKLLEEDDFRQKTRRSLEFYAQDQTMLASTGPDELVKHDVDLTAFLEEPDWSRESVREEYKSVFGLTVDEDCPPHEVEYCEKTDLFYRSQLMADVGGFYKGFGLNPEDKNPERVDHIRLELEFMYYLFTKLLHGRQEGHDSENLETIEDALEDFYREHIGWWVPRFGRALEEKTESDFFARAGRLLRWFCLRERLAFGLPVFDERPEPNVPDTDPEAACFDCAASKMGGQAQTVTP
ncbi:MAG: molecular chaperone [bacterium]